jgi:phosphoserine phosphatase RsbU/P
MSTASPAPRRLEQLLDEVPVGLVLADAGGMAVEVNATFCRWTGYTQDELVGHKRLTDLLTVGGRIFYQTHWLPILQVRGSISEVKFQIRRADGELLTAMMNAVRREIDGQTHDIVSITLAEERNKYERQLILERKRADELAAKEIQAQEILHVAESQVRQAVRVGALHLWYADADGVRHFEPSVSTLLGLEDTDVVTEQDVLGAVVPEDREGEASAYRAALEDPTTVHSWTFKVGRAKQAFKVLLASGQAVGGVSSTKRRFVGVLRDITEEVKKSDDARDRALFAEQMIGIVSHDLRNPLFAISMGGIVLARDPAIGSRHKRVLENIDRSTQRARRLIDDLLDFTLVRVGHGLSVTCKDVDFHELVGRCVQELQQSFPERVIHHVSDGPGECQVDPDRIAQLLGNLVANAVTYGDPSDAITVTSIGGHGEILLKVHNFGPPIPPELQKRMFEPMVRGGKAGSAVRSVGLGLFIVKAIADSHHGSVNVTSTANEGTTFTFALRV